MTEWNNRTPEVICRMQPVMNSCFHESSKFFQDIVDSSADKIWDDLKRKIKKVLKKSAILPKEGKKGKLQYLCFSFMEYGSLLDRIEIRIDAYDSGFYLNEQEVSAEFVLDFWQNRYLTDLNCLDNETEKKFIRVQRYERTEVRRYYKEYYDFAIFRML